MPKQRLFNPDKVAYYEKAGWEAYYERNWPRAFWLLVRLNREEFHMPFFTALSAAWDTVRASRAFAPVDNDLAAAQAHLQKFFTKARPGLQIEASAQKLAELEIGYWIVHRQLALRRIQNHNDQDIEAMIQSLAALHARLFNSTPEAMRQSAEYRALAAKAVDRITGKYSQDEAADWQEVEFYLQRAYRAIMKDYKNHE